MYSMSAAGNLPAPLGKLNEFGVPQNAMAGLKAVGREKSTLYAVNITGPNLIDRASRAIEAGANSIMVNFQAVGWAASEDLVRYLREQNVKVPIFGHSAGMEEIKEVLSRE